MDPTRHIKLGKNISRTSSGGKMHTTFSSSCSTNYNDCQVIPLLPSTSNREIFSPLFYPTYALNRSGNSPIVLKISGGVGCNLCANI
jgi:hypothetical protein